MSCEAPSSSRAPEVLTCNLSTWAWCTLRQRAPLESSLLKKMDLAWPMYSLPRTKGFGSAACSHQTTSAYWVSPQYFIFLSATLIMSLSCLKISIDSPSPTGYSLRFLSVVEKSLPSEHAQPPQMSTRVLHDNTSPQSVTQGRLLLTPCEYCAFSGPYHLGHACALL